MKPQNAMVWQRVFFYWLGRTLKPDGQAGIGRSFSASPFGWSDGLADFGSFRRSAGLSVVGSNQITLKVMAAAAEILNYHKSEKRDFIGKLFF